MLVTWQHYTVAIDAFLLQYLDCVQKLMAPNAKRDCAIVCHVHTMAHTIIIEPDTQCLQSHSCAI